MGDTAGAATPDDVPERVVQATIRLLAEHGPSAIKARAVASASGLSTMVVYSHFGGIPELTRAVIDQGFKELDAAFRQLPVTDDPMTDLALQALTCRWVARENPHLYDLMFGLSTRGSYRPQQTESACASGRSHAFLGAYTHVLDACARLVNTGRVRQQDPQCVAAQLWSFAHGFITLTDDAVVRYDISDFYHPESSRGVRYDDPAFGIEWPFEPVVIAERDLGFEKLRM